MPNRATARDRWSCPAARFACALGLVLAAQAELTGAGLAQPSTPSDSRRVPLSLPEGCGSEADLEARLALLVGPEAVADAWPQALSIAPEGGRRYVMSLGVDGSERQLRDADCPTLLRTAAVILAAAQASRQRENGEAATVPVAVAPVAATVTTAEPPPNSAASNRSPDMPTSTRAPHARAPRRAPSDNPEPPAALRAPAEDGPVEPAATADSRDRADANPGADADQPPLEPPEPARPEADASDAATLAAAVFGGGGAAVRVGPALAPLASLGAALEWPRVGLQAELYYVAPTLTDGDNRVSVGAAGLRLGVQLRPWPVLRVALGPELCRLSGAGEGTRIRGESGAAWVPGAFVEAAPKLWNLGPWALELALSARLGAARPSFQIGDFQEVFRSPRWSAGLALRLRWRSE